MGSYLFIRARGVLIPVFWSTDTASYACFVMEKQAITPQLSSSFAFHFLRTILSDRLRSTSSPTSFILLSHNGMACSPWHPGLRLGGRVLVSCSSALFRTSGCPLLTTHRPQTEGCPYLRYFVLCEDGFQKACTR